MMKRVFGIDLGTTYSCIAYMDDYGKPVVLKNSDGDHTTPSVVLVESADNVIVGSEAKRSIEMESDKTVQFIKRKMGREKDKVTLNGTTYSAPEISAYILKKLVADANAELLQNGVIAPGQEVRDVVITCPAYFGMNERQATRTAGELAGLNVLSIINEPTAAAISYGVSTAAKQETVLVYDLGGGTFDITVMNISGNNISVVCTGGDDQLGGKDWDEALMNYIVERYQEELDEDLSEDPEVIAGLYVDVETWKKALTSREKVNITVNGPAGRFREEMTRKHYEELTRHLLLRTKNLLDDVLRTAEKQGYPLQKIDKILLVGGSSKMPQVAAMLQQDYHVAPSLQDPDEAVAKGAAIYAQNEKQFTDFVLEEAARTGKSVDDLMEEELTTHKLGDRFLRSGGASGGMKISIQNVLSRTYGVIALDQYDQPHICNILMINAPLPASNTQTFYTVAPNQTGISIELMESRSTDPYMEIDGRKPLTTIQMRFQRSVPQGTSVDIALSLDNTGILHVSAVERECGSKLDTTFTLSNQMSDRELRDAGRRLGQTNVE